MSHMKRYIVLGFLWLSHFLVDFSLGIFPIYKTIIGLDIATMGIIAGIAVFIGEALQLYFGHLSDRGYQQLLIIIGIAVTSCAVFASCTKDYFVLYLLFQATTLGSGCFHPAAVALVGSLSTRSKGLFITVFATGGAIGFSLSQLIFSTIYLKIGHYCSFLIIPSLLVAIILMFYKLENNFTKNTALKTKITFKSICDLFKKKHLTCLYFTQICNQIVFWGTIFLLPDLLMARGYDKWICFGGGHLAFVLGGALMMIPSGLLADKYSYRTVILTASSLSAIFFFTFLNFPLISNSSLAMLFFLMGASIMTVGPLVIAFGNKLYPEESGIVSAFLMGFALCLANPIGQTGAGLLTKLFDENAETKSLTILGLFFFVGIATSSFLPKKVENYKNIQV